MKNIFNYLLTISISGFLILGISSCKKDSVTSVSTDRELYEMAKSTSDFTWFKNSDTLLPKSSGSAHVKPFLKTRYNSIAATMLDANGYVKSNIVFPEGSLIVKELYDNANTLSRYAILYKKSSDPNADAKGWVWGYINTDGSVAESASAKGKSCISCHSQSDNIDYMLMNKYFP